MPAEQISTKAGTTPANGSALITDQPAKAKVFISYSRKDIDFADRIEASLNARGLQVFIDRHEISALEEWWRWKRIETLITQADTVVFVLSPDSLASKYAQKEVSFASSLNKRFAPIVYRGFDGQLVPEALAKLNYVFFDDEAKFEASADKLAQALRIDITWVRRHTEFGAAAHQWSAANRPNGLLLRSPVLEEAERWIAARPEGAPTPTEETRSFIEDSRAATGRRRNILTASLISGLVLALGLSGYAFYQRSQVQRELDRANNALAAAIRNDFIFLPNLPLTGRESQALWSLAVADKEVKRSFISTLAENPTELIRVSPGFIQISRALGLMWPSQAEAKTLFDSALKGFTGAALANFCLPELKILAKKLNEEQTAKALDRLLVQLGQANQVQVLRGLPQAIQALAPKLTETQARQAIDPVLHRLRQTTDAIAFQELVQAFQALHARSPAADVQQVFDLLLRRIDDTRIPYQVTALAQALQVLAPELTATQARQALGSVLQQIGETVEPTTLQALAQAIQAIPADPSGADAEEAFDRLLRKIRQQRISVESRPLAQAIRSLAPKLTESQAQGAIDRVVQEIGDTTDTYVLGALAQTLQVLVAKQPKLQAGQTLDSVMEQFNQGANPKVLRMAGQELRALAPKLTQMQVPQAFDEVLRHLTETEDQSVVQALAQALEALTSKLRGEQAQRMLNPILQQVGTTFD
jgi:hypothetical protein